MTLKNHCKDLFSKHINSSDEIIILSMYTYDYRFEFKMFFLCSSFVIEIKFFLLVTIKTMHTWIISKRDFFITAHYLSQLKTLTYLNGALHYPLWKFEKRQVFFLLLPVSENTSKFLNREM